MCVLLAFAGFLLCPEQGVKSRPLKTGSHSGKDTGASDTALLQRQQGRLSSTWVTSDSWFVCFISF